MRVVGSFMIALGALGLLSGFSLIRSETREGLVYLIIHLSLIAFGIFLILFKTIKLKNKH